MRNFEYKIICEKLLTPDIVSLLTGIHEHKGRQDVFFSVKKDILHQLKEIAKIQSTDSSNRIEGIYTSEKRLKLLVLDKVMPQNRNEQEIAGYKDVLTSINESHDYILQKPNVFLQLHRDLYKYSGNSIGGNYKTTNNTIEEVDTQGNRYLRFEPVSAWETHDAIEKICSALEEVKGKNVEPLLIIPVFILDFLCIHPFSDGNGRMSRLITLLLLYRFGYIVGKYISIERLIEKSKETYYEVLLQSSQNWHDNKNDYSAFVKYYLGLVLAAYREFTVRAEDMMTSGLLKTDRVKELIKSTLEKITKRDILEKLPDISKITVERALKELVDNNQIIKISGGRYTQYIWNWENE
ncbi:MAG: Fic family protein [Oscillospiraceae bacterium]|nr:Fic family protein [Oscillospiraceae bacterium]